MVSKRSPKKFGRLKFETRAFKQPNKFWATATYSFRKWNQAKKKRKVIPREEITTNSRMLEELYTHNSISIKIILKIIKLDKYRQALLEMKHNNKPAY